MCLSNVFEHIIFHISASACLGFHYIEYHFTFISLNDCSLHLTSSVGHNVNDEKNAAITPATALLQ